MSGEVRETDLFLSCHLSCHRTGYHSPPLSLVKRGKGGNKFGTAPWNFRISQCLSVAVSRALRYDIFRWWSASRPTRYSPLGMQAARLPRAGEGGLEIPFLSLGLSFWKSSGAESGAAEQWSNRILEIHPIHPHSPPQLLRAEGKKGQAALLCLATQPLSRGAERATQPVSHLQPGIEHRAQSG